MSEPTRDAGAAPDSPRKSTFLTFPRVLALSLALGALLRLPALGVGFVGDEELQLSALEGRASSGMTRFDLWRFHSGDPAEGARLIHDGYLPWWTRPDLKMAFLRPLSSVVFAAEHALFGRNPVGYHALNLVWALLLITVVALFFRKVLPGAIGAVATLLFAVQGIHWEVAGMICARHFLIASVASFAGFLAYLRYREEGYRPGLPLAFLGFAVGLAGGEEALQVLAYVLAYELFAARGTWMERARALLVPSVPAALYLLCYKLLGYGTFRMAPNYTDPFAEPLQWLKHGFSAARLSLALLFGVEGFAGESGSFKLTPDTRFYNLRWLLVALLVAMIAGLFVFLARASDRLVSQAERRTLRFLLAGALLSFAPVIGAVPGPRLLVIPGVGVAALIAALLRAAWLSLRAPADNASPSRIPLIALGALLLLIHGLLSPAQLAMNLSSLSKNLQRWTLKNQALVAQAEIDKGRDQDVIVIAAGPSSGALEHKRLSTRTSTWMVLSVLPVEHELLRTGPNTAEVIIHAPSTRPAGEKGYPTVGQKLSFQGDFTLEVVEAVATNFDEKNSPTRLALRSARSLDDPGIRFLLWRDGALRKVSVPPIGERVSLPLVPEGRSAPRAL
ncbi:MAG: hypothetical protein ABI193_06840 [Minicystis sp.]